MKKLVYNKVRQVTRKMLYLSFILFFIIGSVLSGLVAWFYQAEFNSFLSEIKIQEKNALSYQRLDIMERFNDVVGDLMFLSRQNELLNYLNLEDVKTKKAIQKEYISMALSKKIYDQIRYIDIKGMECVRVDFADGKPEAIPEGKLQNKANRYYFIDTVVLKKNEMFVSPLDLNVENGKIEEPFKPMIRFGTPVFDDKGMKGGMVMLNYLAKNMLDSIEIEKDGKMSEVMLLNMEGYWLLNPTEEKKWGHLLKDRAEISFAMEYPEEWHTFREQRSGQINTENGLFTFVTVYPLKEGAKSCVDPSSPSEFSPKKLDHLEYSWVLVSHVPFMVIKGYKQELLKKIFVVGTGLFCLVLFFVWQLTLTINKRRIYQSQLIELAYYDPLTKLPNRNFFFDRLEEEISHAHRHGRRIGLLYVDLDGFKKINDTMGHDAGDELLSSVGSALKKNLRKEDTVGRLGGDEFAIILSEIKTPEDAKLVGEKVVSAMGQPFQLKSGIAQIGASVGAAIFPDHEVGLDALVKKADSAMYKAKSKGKNTCVIGG